MFLLLLDFFKHTMKNVILKSQLKKQLVMISYKTRFAHFSKFKGLFFDQNMQSTFVCPE